MHKLSPQRLTFGLIIGFLIVMFDVVVVRTTLFQEHHQWLTAGIVLDFVVVLPLLIYFILFRVRKKKLSSVLPVALIGYLSLLLFMPAQSQDILQIIKYIIIPLELLFLAFTGYEMITLIRRNRRAEHPHPIEAMGSAMSHTFGQSKLSAMLLHELSVLYYTLFAWRQKPFLQSDSVSFSYHTRSSGLITLLILFKILLLEGIVIHILLMNWSPLAAWIMTLGNVYVLMMLVADYRAMKLNPILLSRQTIRLRYGLKLTADLPLAQLTSISVLTPGQLSKDELKAAITPSATEPNIRFCFEQPLVVACAFGRRKAVNQLDMFVDEPQAFQELINQWSDECRLVGPVEAKPE